MEIANGVEEVTRQKGYITFMCNMERDPQIEKEYIDHLIMRKVDGIILMYSSLSDEYMSWIRDEKIPTVMIGENELRPDWNSVKADGEVPDDILKDLLDKAYEIVLRSFSKKKQKEILGDN